MKKTIYLLLSLVAAFTTHAQNMVVNGNFENYTGCPTSPSQIWRVTGWRDYLGTPDFLHICGTNPFITVPQSVRTYQHPASGNGHAGIVSFSHITNLNTDAESLAGILTPLKAGRYYEASISVSLSDQSNVGNNALSFFLYKNGTGPNLSFSPNLIPQVSFSSYGPITDTQNWVRLTKIFQADSAYENIIILPLRPASGLIITQSSQNSSFYLLDSVVIKPYFEINLSYTDTLACMRDSIHVPFTTNQRFDANNSFILQLSDATGSFSNPATIGTLAGDTSGIINGRYPSFTGGNNYRIRIVATHPSFTSPDNGKNIRIKTAPIASVSSNNPVCQGDLLSFSSVTLPGSTFSWQGPAGFASTQQNPALLTTSSLHSGAYILTALLDGCTAKDTVNAIVKALPVITTIGSNAPICETQNLDLNLSTTTPTAPVSWTGPNGFSSTSLTPGISSATVNATGRYIATLSLNGCTAKDTVDVIVNPMPGTPTAASNSPVCRGKDLNLTASGSLPGATYIWSGPASFASNTQNPTLANAHPGMGGNYSVTASLNGCTSVTTTTAVNVLYFTATVDAHPLPNDTICVGGTIQFVAVSSNSGAMPQYKWLKNGSVIPGATAVSYVGGNMVTGDRFAVVVTPDNTCPDPDTSIEIPVAVLPYVTPSVTITATPGLLISPWQHITFTATPVNGGKAPTYQWKRNGQDIVGATGDTWGAYTLSNNDTIGVEMTSSETCPAPAGAISNKLTVAVKMDVAGEIREESLALYPNPNNGSFMLKGKVNSSAPMKLRVQNAVGQMVYSSEIVPKNGMIETNISLQKDQNLPAGVYILKLEGDAVLQTIHFSIR